MPAQKELLKEMLTGLETLIDTAKKLNEASERSIAEDEVEELQAKQEKIIEQLVQLDRLVATSPEAKNTTEETDAIKKEIQKKLHSFHRINEHFFEQLRHRLSLI